MESNVKEREIAIDFDDINAIPSEILAHIFSFLVHEGDDEEWSEEKWNNLSRSLVRSSRVCSHWYTNITNLPSWGQFSLFIRALNPYVQKDIDSFMNQPCLKGVPELVFHGLNEDVLNAIPNFENFKSTKAWKQILHTEELAQKKSLVFRHVLRLGVASKVDEAHIFSLSSTSTVVFVRDPSKKTFGQTLKHVSEIGNLPPLSLYGTWLGVDATPLSKMNPPLKELVIFGTDMVITPQTLSKLTELCVFRHPNASISTELWNVILSLDELEELVVNISLLAHNEVIHDTTHLPKLESFAVYTDELPLDTVFAFLQPFLPKLDRLGIFGRPRMTKEEIIEILKCSPKLKALIISNSNKLSDRDIEHIQHQFGTTVKVVDNFGKCNPLFPF
eukprot:TRINITY_DN1073_c0_g1_i1.p1 TRINITY_DN1073_c0_g1~~TRINITY_DN1073_c0_g1_i1.p1  ORF type:complete len:389 (-),score=57.85 TRINITY_DN1073_c0_g1_i1:125-1291(-)